MNTIFNLSRRTFLKTGASVGAGLTLGLYLPKTLAESEKIPVTTTEIVLEPNAFVRIGTDNTVTVTVKHVEMGQGTYTGLPTLVAEELDADWAQIKVVGAPADAGRYNNLFWGPVQGTGGSTAMANSFEQMRVAGATARKMLITAAAQAWKVPAEEIVIKAGVVSHPASKHQASFGELAELASHVAVPEHGEIKLKEPKDFVYIGKMAIKRKDTKAKTNGTAIYTQDINFPDLLTAVVAHSPRFGGKVKSVDMSKAKAVKGVVNVVEIPTGVAVLAKDFWTAKKGRDALVIEWDNSQAFMGSSADILADYKKQAESMGKVARREGDVETNLPKTTKKRHAEYVFPFLAHATMEPMNCVVKLSKDSCEVWNGEQFQTIDQANIAQVVGLKPEQVKINMLYAGGSFGRRANPKSDYVKEAASIAKAVEGTPIKLVWTREDDMQGGQYRPFYYHTIDAGLDEKGNVTAWHHRIVGQSIIAGSPFEGFLIKEGIDATSVEGASTLPYQIPNLLVDLHTTSSQIPIQWWRSVGSTHTAFSTETMLDELAHDAGKDPVEFRLALLKEHPRHAGVLKLAAEKAGWGTPLAKGKGRGVAVHESFNTYVAQVAEVTVKEDGTFSVDRVVCAVDCGIAINPDVIRAQMEGGLGYGLSATLAESITFKDGLVEQSNFHNYPVLRINQMPSIEVYIVESTEKPTGVGEPATPVIAPAVANALFAVTGKRLYELPLKLA
ncbi:aerobic-type carbon monoxide dehydrogenase, large subunit CoxL/CutL-like protein [Beggiatoa alba B18LD]|uniref:Aerobic-type carbon monoxide dehydrogenase, large subunit CoxL/CutL-like protein n=1 Tax=Beggiatoa alba B18LD TaxID=395493 RepID=I3CDV7_9GAMM|nr:molybdopterin cofactor-binding domain-containing protein [Beggiatoa alba]EIJ41800.1 aerobic-type carbon monoxide dehydrogenase, large subunit CoxL/CutL-like protein [Beggiatoa alba B18LD]